MLKLSRNQIPWVVISLILILDQVSKVIVKTSMTIGQGIPVFGDWFILYFIENDGMAFGMQFSGEYGKLALSLFRIVAVAFIGWYIFRLIQQKVHKGLIVCISMIMAGALGNILDSAFYGMLFSESTFISKAQFLPEGGGYATFLHGKVVDMLYFPLIRGNFPQWFPFWAGEEFIFFRPVFNLADSAITTGVLTLLIFQKKFFAHERKEDPADDSEEEKPVSNPTDQVVIANDESDPKPSSPGSGENLSS